MPSSLLTRIDDNTRLAGHNRLALLLFELGNEVVFGINVFKVREVLQTPPVRPLPKSPPAVAGVIRVREQSIPVLDLAKAMGLGCEGAGGIVMLTEFNRSVQGFLVAKVDRIIHKPVESVQPPPLHDPHGDGFLTAVTRHDGKLVEILDVERLLSDLMGESPELSQEWCRDGENVDAGGRAILVADDSRVARAQIVRTLDSMGLESLVVNDGRAALRALQSLADQGPIDETVAMVISDVEMPDMDGYRLATEIRADARLARLPIVLHTSLSGVFNQALVQKVGADHFVPKFSPNDLAAAVKACLQANPELRVLRQESA